jgi:hypothetical protein
MRTFYQVIKKAHQGEYCVCQPKTNKLISSHKNKVQALLEATRLRNQGQPCVIWYLYYHDTYKNFNKDLLGKTPLKTLYKERAQQLRDNYDELILYYSGGADSHNILHTFLENNIKLDYVFVRWPSKMLDKGLYTPNISDTSANNFVSEWDYAIKPDLEYLKNNHPEIKIITADWLEQVDLTKYNDDLFTTQNHMHSAVNFLRMQSYSDVEIDLLNRGKRVAAIWGTDKPRLKRNPDNGQVSFYFRDDVIQNAVPVNSDANNVEYFYWTPDMPILAYEMAYQLFLWFKANPDKQDFLNINDDYFICSEITKQVCYPYWDFKRFQAAKPLGFRKDKDFWFYDHAEFSPLVDRWQYYYQSQLDNISKDYLKLDNQGNPVSYKWFASPPYYLGNLDQP